MNLVDYLVAGAFALVLLSFAQKIAKASRRHYPPGPKGYPIIGNVWDLSSAFQWLNYAKWSKEYDSDIVHVRIMGKSTIVLSSLEAVTQLLDKRSAIYSDRPAKPMMLDVLDFNSWNLAFMRYGNSWRAHRKCFTQSLNINAIDAHQPTQAASLKKLLKSFHEKPEGFQEAISNHAGRIIMKVAYDYDVTSEPDVFIEMSNEAFRQFADICFTGKVYLVDTFPILTNLPTWVPGFKFHRRGAKFRELTMEMMEKPFEIVQKKMDNGTAQSCCVVDSLEKSKHESPTKEEIDVIKHTASVIYPAGYDTSTSTLATFILVMLLNPSIQKRAQAEVDAVTLGTRLPDFADKPSLPQVYRVLLETLRWAPAAPLGIEHSVMEDDVWKGWDIPKGCTVIGNIWAILHDETVFPEPLKFDPDRFKPTESDTGEINKHLENYVLSTAFGFGRRICPGRHLALNTVWLSMAQILATFDILKQIGKDGKEVEPFVGYTNGITTHPQPFKARIVARSEEVIKLLDS